MKTTRRSSFFFGVAAGISVGRSDRPRRIDQRRAGAGTRAFTLLEILLSLALVALMLVALNTFVFSMGELWGRNTDVRLFDQHVRAVTRFMEHELRAAVLPPAAVAKSTPIGLKDITPQGQPDAQLLTFELPSGSRLFVWPDPKRPLPEVVCSLQARPNEGLILLWHSRLEKNFDTDPPRETVITPLCTALAYDYYDTDSQQWSTLTDLKPDPNGGTTPLVPQRLRLKFVYGKMTAESVIVMPVTSEGLPLL